jgi:Ca2+-binding RTX toxin-like protein
MCVFCDGNPSAELIYHPSGEAIAGPTDATGVALPTGFATGVQNIDAMLWGTRWSSTALTFTFPQSATYYPTPYEDEPGGVGTQPAGFQAVTAELAAAFRLALKNYASVSLLTFTEVGPTQAADVTAARTANDTPTASGRFPGYGANEGDVWFNLTDYNAPVVGNYGFHNVLHEIGHTMGLKHGHASDHGLTNQALTADRNSVEFSVMTYQSYVGGNTNGYTNETFGYSQSLMMFDIAALQRLYGANFASNAGATTYSFSETTGEMFLNGVGQGAPGGNRIFRTVWDGGGVDTYDFSNYTGDQSIDLTPGGWSRFSEVQLSNLGDGNFARANLYNALQFNNDARSLIENAIGGSGNDAITGNAANNRLTGGAGADTLTGAVGNDILVGGDGSDRMIGGLGADTMFGGGLKTGGGGGGDGIALGSGVITFTTNPGNNFLATAVDVTKQFSLASDALIGDSTSTPHVTINSIGNGANDFYKVVLLEAGSTITVDVDQNGVTNPITDTILYIFTETGVALASGDDSVTIDPGSSLRPGGTDTTDAFLSYKITTPGTYYIGVYRYNPATDTFDVLPAGQRYRMHVSVEGEPLASGAGSGDLFEGGDGRDTVTYAAVTGGVGVGVDLALATAQTMSGAAKGDVLLSIEALIGTRYADTLIAAATGGALSGGDGADKLTGRGGADTLNGGAGADTMTGGLGADVYVVDGAGDRVVEAANGGTDAVLSAVTHTLALNVEKLTLTGAAAINGTGNALANTMTGNAAANLLNGGAGADTMQGGLGNDRYVVDNAGDKVVEAANGGTDTVLSTVTHALALNVEKLILTGTAAANGFGNALANTISGNSGRNILDGGLGADTLTGGAGGDTFLFRSALSAANFDAVTDFSVVDDTIRLENSVFLGLADGALGASAFTKGTVNVASDAFDRIIYNSASGALFFDRDGSGATYSAIRFAILDQNLALTAQDFLVV